MNYVHIITVPWSYDEAVQRVRESLVEEGFDILSENNVRSVFEAKLGTERADALGGYLILGVANSELVRRALISDQDPGVLVPFDVVIRRGPDATSAVVQAMVRLSDNPVVKDIANDANTLLRAVLENLNVASP